VSKKEGETDDLPGGISGKSRGKSSDWGGGGTPTGEDSGGFFKLKVLKKRKGFTIW